MDDAYERDVKVRIGVGRVLGVLGTASLIFIVGVALRPFATSAHQEARFLGPLGSDAQPTLGEMSGPNLTVRIFARPGGPRYTVADADGRVLHAGLSDVDMRRLYPQLRIDDLAAGVDASVDSAHLPLD